MSDVRDLCGCAAVVTGSARNIGEEIAALVRFLCGSEARYISGQTLHANGGAYPT